MDYYMDDVNDNITREKLNGYDKYAERLVNDFANEKISYEEYIREFAKCKRASAKLIEMNNRYIWEGGYRDGIV